MLFEQDFSKLQWHAAQLKPNGLKAAKTHLARQGFQTLMPMLPVSKRVQNRLVQKQEPLFPGYVFVGISSDGLSWRKINSTTGVGRLVAGLNGEPAQLPTDFIGQLVDRMDQHGIRQPPADLPAGTKVRIKVGPFTNWIAEVETNSKDERLNLFLSLMGRIVRASVPLREVEIA